MSQQKELRPDQMDNRCRCECATSASSFVLPGQYTLTDLLFDERQITLSQLQQEFKNQK